MTTLPYDTHPVADAGTAERRYTTVAIILHWVIAAAIAFQLIGGKWMVSAGAAATGSVFTVFQIHETVGITILALTLARLVWRLANPAPALPAGMNGFERAAAHVTHVAFYVLLIALPLSGWAMASVSPTGVPTFFLLLENLPFAHLPLLGDAGLTERHTAEAFFKGVHENLSFAMAALIALHILAALKHQLIARDNLLARMIVSARTLPNSVASATIGGIAASAALLFIIAGIGWGIAQTSSGPATATSTAQAPAASSGGWVIDHDQSALGFTLTFSGNAVAATVDSWSGEIVFDPDDLEGSRATIGVDMASITLANSTLQAQSAGGDGFDLANHATATYQAESFERIDDGQFRADGKFNLRGATVDVPLTFSFVEEDGTARVSGTATVNRLDFGIGAVGAANEAWLLYGVDIAFDLVAMRPQ